MKDKTNTNNYETGFDDIINKFYKSGNNKNIRSGKNDTMTGNLKNTGNM